MKIVKQSPELVDRKYTRAYVVSGPDNSSFSFSDKLNSALLLIQEDSGARIIDVKLNTHVDLPNKYHTALITYESQS